MQKMRKEAWEYEEYEDEFDDWGVQQA